MTTAEVAELLRAPQETVRYWRHLGKGPRSFKVGRRVLYPAADVRAWLTELETSGVHGGGHAV
jgi:excisionase family DNA binding protein